MHSFVRRLTNFFAPAGIVVLLGGVGCGTTVTPGSGGSGSTSTSSTSVSSSVGSGPAYVSCELAETNQPCEHLAESCTQTSGTNPLQCTCTAYGWWCNACPVSEPAPDATCTGGDHCAYGGESCVCPPYPPFVFQCAACPAAMSADGTDCPAPGLSCAGDAGFHCECAKGSGGSQWACSDCPQGLVDGAPCSFTSTCFVGCSAYFCKNGVTVSSPWCA